MDNQNNVEDFNTFDVVHGWIAIIIYWQPHIKEVDIQDNTHAVPIIALLNV